MSIDLTDRNAVDAALDSGKGVFYGDPLFLHEDGSVRNIANQEEARADAHRAASYTAFPGFVPATASNLNALSITDYIKPLVAVTNPAPAVTGLAVGVQYFNSTEKKLKVLTEGTPNAWADNDPNITAGGTIWFVPSGASAGMYRFVTDTLVKL